MTSLILTFFMSFFTLHPNCAIINRSMEAFRKRKNGKSSSFYFLQLLMEMVVYFFKIFVSFVVFNGTFHFDIFPRCMKIFNFKSTKNSFPHGPEVGSLQVGFRDAVEPSNSRNFAPFDRF
jgi:D-alanyl-lipoteichoic acid acyltransferase DltB (MBOAT superfamily)